MTSDRSVPFFDWSSVFHIRDIIRFPDGSLGVVRDLWDCSEESNPPIWEMYVQYERSPGQVDSGIVKCSAGCEPAPDVASRAEAERRGLLDGV